MQYFGSKKLKKTYYIFQKCLDLDKVYALGWGRKKSFFKAKAYAETHGLDVLCLEDGFIRSLGLGKDGCSPLSLVVDKLGIYFDAYQVSDLENVILLDENQDLNIRAKHIIETILKYKISKYNQKFDNIDPTIFDSEKQHILVVDQTFGDQSIQYAGANQQTFKLMLQQALDDYPTATIWVKIHPDVLAGKSQGHFDFVDLQHPRVKVLSQNYNPIELLPQFSHVFVVSSQLGFEALLCGKQVYCFGVPWYAGWGLTDDQYAPLHIIGERRGKKRSLEHLFACAYLKYACYVNPITGKKCELEDILELLIPNIEAQKYVPNLISAYGFSRWKRKFIRDFLNFPKTQITFYSFCKPNKNDTVLAWGKKAHYLKQQGYENVITVEDGFIRSVGLGAKLIRPCSLVFDDVGIYYDATRPSRLENLLQYRPDLTEEEHVRAISLWQMLIELNITKYNVGVHETLQRPFEQDRVILVIGQVEDDMSVQLGGVGIKTNLALLEKVRQKNPTAYIIYKPHPDVLEGLRVGNIPDHIALKFCNYIEKKVSILDCFNICDEVHTISSLSGFEALLRGLKVYCYGLPFYAGWGLTKDEYKCERRTHKISCEKLIFCTLIEYPLYNFTKINTLPTIQPENVIEHISQIRYFPTFKPFLFKFINFFK
ncbi:capsular polysaccharide biosynthesis protein [Acinetobacter equi]|uniref:Capsule biosynthesis protein n=1 Tax=Acinetobacter equi TaxID=1324350 RepID=A0A0N9VZI3_9GAMM|nr:capsular polysaccharide biosynthesis protein [Acinetobacter equi]ALH94685.1 hypothetical protein AOY20_03580 [Acinetobacter equi]